jgi:tRNA pseudouridine55 synthase
MDGVVVLDKPAGMTSHDVVDAIRDRLGTRKVGHAGTLDPDATGVLLIGVGRATRFLSYAQDAPKSYRAGARFGVVTSTQDASGEVLEERDAVVEREDVERELKRFLGTIEQVPPMVSAIKVEGERLYKKARRGEEVERAARRVTIYTLELVEFEPGVGPQATLDIRCSSGTFVRTLIHDLGSALGCGAHMTSLRRTEAGGFTDADAIGLDDVSADNLRPLLDAVRVLPRLDLDDDQASDVEHGRALKVPFEADAEHIAMVHGDSLRAVYKPREGMLVADRVLSS